MQKRLSTADACSGRQTGQSPGGGARAQLTRPNRGRGSRIFASTERSELIHLMNQLGAPTCSRDRLEICCHSLYYRSARIISSNAKPNYTGAQHDNDYDASKCHKVYSRRTPLWHREVRGCVDGSSISPPAGEWHY